MIVAAHVEPLSDLPEDRRTTPRMQLSLGAVVGDSQSSARIHDLSTNGLLFETSAELPDDRVQVQLPDTPPVQARVAWRHGRFFGCEFIEPIPVASVSAALLRSEPPARPGSTGPAAGGDFELASDRNQGRRWLKAGVAVALALAGAAYLIATGHIILLAVIAATFGTIAAALMLLANWGLINTRDMKL